MGNALLIRHLPSFGLQLEWHGNAEVLVTDGKTVIGRVDTGFRGLRYATDTMKKVAEQMHRDATAMCC
jgi:hypothetical protein